MLLWINFWNKLLFLWWISKRSVLDSGILILSGLRIKLLLRRLITLFVLFYNVLLYIFRYMMYWWCLVVLFVKWLKLLEWRNFHFAGVCYHMEDFEVGSVILIEWSNFAKGFWNLFMTEVLNIFAFNLNYLNLHWKWVSWLCLNILVDNEYD